MKIMSTVMTAAFSALCAVNANAEVHVGIVRLESNGRKAEIIKPMGKSQKVLVECRYCKPYEPLIKGKLQEAGYIVADEEGGAAVKVVMSASIYVNKNGDAIRLDAEDITDEYAAQIPPAISKRLYGRRAGNARSILNTDMGVTRQGALLTGSATGGAIVGILGAFGGRLLDQHLLNQKRAAGTADVFVEVALHDGNYLLALDAAADTPETPDAIVRTAFTSAVELLASGIAPQPKTFTDGDSQW